MDNMNPNFSSGYMFSEVIVRGTYGSETVVFSIDNTTSFLDFSNEVGMRFDLKAGMFELKYSLPDHPSCALSSDVDLKLMLRSLTEYNKKSVDVLVRTATAKCVDGEMAFNVDDSLGFRYCEGADYLGDFRPEDPKVFMSRQWKDFIKSVDQKFLGGAKEFREKLRLFAIELGFMFTYTRNDRWRVVAHCSNKESEGCEWHVNASSCPANKFFYIRKLNNVHTCSSVLRQQKHKLMSSGLVKMLIIDEFRSNPSLKPHDIMDRLRNTYGIDITYRVAWNSKEKALNELHGSDEESYGMLSWYRDAVLETNPGSCFVLEWDEHNGRFQRLFMCFGGVIEGFKSCIPLLFVDGAHVKSKFKGTMLSATGKDGNQGFFPFAIAIVSGETDDNWNWFFENLKSILDPQGRMITFVTDRGRGLINSLGRVFPENPHSYCLFHLKLNLQDMLKGDKNKALRNTLAEKFYSVAYSCTERQYYYALRQFLDEDQDVAQKFLKDLPVEKWCNAFFKGCRFGEMANSTAEAFNSWTLDARGLPVFPMLEKVRKKMMGMMAERKVLVQKWTLPLCPVMQKELVKNMDIGRDWTVTRSDIYVYEVHSPYSSSVDLWANTCTCRQWQTKSFPCAHALAVMQKSGYDVYSIIAPFYFKSEYLKSYSVGIKPIPDMERKYVESSSTVLVKPPLTRRPSGRPKSKRIKSKGEVAVRAITCNRCGKAERHNRTSCIVPI